MANRKERREAARKKGKDGANPDLSDQEAIEPDAVLDGADMGGFDGTMPFPDHEEDVVFKVQMQVQNLVLGHWKKLLAVTSVVLLVVLIVGEYNEFETSTQQAIQSQIADIDLKMPPMSQEARFGIAEEAAAVIDNVKLGAAEYENVAREGSGAGSLMAWMRAGTTWERAGDVNKAKEAYGAAHAVGAGDVLGWSAASAYATLQANTGDVDGAIATLRSLDGKVTGMAAEQALLSIALILEDAGRSGESKSVYEEFNSKYSGSTWSKQVSDGLARLESAG
ncbi:MAG: tetratricopeptide repeat protein [Myxococcota bacterium]